MQHKDPFPIAFSYKPLQYTDPLYFYSGVQIAFSFTMAFPTSLLFFKGFANLENWTGEISKNTLGKSGDNE